MKHKFECFGKYLLDTEHLLTEAKKSPNSRFKTKSLPHKLTTGDIKYNYFHCSTPSFNGHHLLAKNAGLCILNHPHPKWPSYNFKSLMNNGKSIRGPTQLRGRATRCIFESFVRKKNPLCFSYL